MKVSDQIHARFTSGKEPRSPLNKGWVGPRAGLDDLEKAKVLLPPAGTQTPDGPACSLVTIPTAPYRLRSAHSFSAATSDDTLRYCHFIYMTSVACFVYLYLTSLLKQRICDSKYTPQFSRCQALCVCVFVCVYKAKPNQSTRNGRALCKVMSRGDTSLLQSAAQTGRNPAAD